MSRQLPPRPSLEYLKKEAKDILGAHGRRDPTACAVLKNLRQFAGARDEDILTTPLPLSEVQFALALDYGFAGWNELVAQVTGQPVEGAPSPQAVAMSSGLVAECEAEVARKPASQRNTDELIALLVTFARTARSVGLVGLDAFPERLDEELLRQGLRWTVDGTDRNLVADLMATRKKALIAAYERRLDMMIAGCVGVSEGLNPGMLEAKCRAML